MTSRLSGPGNVRFNFACGVLHGVFYRAGIAFSEPTSVLPVFLNHYTGSLTMIGLFSALIQGGGVIPQLFVANRVERAPRKKPLLLVAIWIRAAAWGVLGLLAYFWHSGDTTLVLAALLALLFVFSFAGGVAAVPFNDLWGKVLPATIRAAFSVTANFGAGCWRWAPPISSSVCWATTSSFFRTILACFFCFRSASSLWPTSP